MNIQNENEREIFPLLIDRPSWFLIFYVYHLQTHCTLYKRTYKSENELAIFPLLIDRPSWFLIFYYHYFIYEVARWTYILPTVCDDTVNVILTKGPCLNWYREMTLIWHYYNILSHRLVFFSHLKSFYDYPL